MVHSQKVQEITIVGNNALINHRYLDFCADDRPAMVERLNANTSFVAGFFSGQELVFVAVFDIEPGCLHIRQVGGHFAQNFEYLDVFAEGVAKALKLTSVSFKSERAAVEKFAASRNYRYIPEVNEFSRAVH